MAMTALHWKYVGSAVPASNIPSNVLDALYTLGTAVTYADSTTRTPGSGSAGTWDRKQVAGLTEATWCNPATNSHTVRHIFGASASARTPTMISSPADTWATNTILYGFSRSGATLNATGNGWDQALPFDTGSAFSGYARACALGTFTIAKVHLFECEVGAVVLWATTTGMVETIFGLLLDPGVTNATSPNSAEATSGGRYCFRTCGGTVASTTTAWTTSLATATTFFAHSTSANGNHCFAVNIGAATLTAAERQLSTLQASDGDSFLTPDGDINFQQCLQLGADTGGRFFGRLREMAPGPDTTIGLAARQSGTAKAYAASTHPSTQNDTLWLIA